MVFLVEDFVNLPAEQIANIWLAAHMKRKLNKKDIKKTKLGEACSQLHSDKTKKPMQLRHYGQCLIGISWIHYKQVEYLHNDCNEAFSKARLVFVRKRNVDLDPSKERGRANDITLLQNNNNNNNNNNINDAEIMDIDLNKNNLSQLYLADDNISEIGSLLNDSGNHNINLALDHEITLQQNELLPGDGRRSSFGNISSLLMGDMDIEIKFDDDDNNMENNEIILDESQAQRDNINEASLTDIDDDISIERGRAINESIPLVNDNLSDIPLMDDNSAVISHISHISHIDPSHSVIKDKTIPNIDDMDSVNTGSVIDDMDIDDHIGDNIDVQSMHSLHVGFNLDENESVTTTTNVNNGSIEEGTPTPDAKRGKRKEQINKKKVKKDKDKRKRKRKKKKRKRFEMDDKIELDRNELRCMDIERADFIYPGGRDPIHIWREFPLSTLEFDELLYQPLSKELFGKLPMQINKQFELCNKINPVANNDANNDDNNNNNIDELSNINILRNENQDIENVRDMSKDLHADLELPMHDFDMDNNNNIELEMNEPEIESLLQESNIDNNININMDDNISTIESLCNDAIPPPKDALFDNDIIDQENIEPLHDLHADIDMMDEDENNENIQVDNSNHLSFEPNDENIMTQTNQEDLMGDIGIKPRDWSRRARKTFSFFKRKEGKEFSFNELMESQTKRETVAGVFYELLVFKNSDLVDLQQTQPYGDITITKTNNFYRHARLSQRLSQR